MSKQVSEVDLMIEILNDATARSNKANVEPRNFEEPQELALIFDLIDAKHIRGEVLASMEGPPRGAAMWGITLSGREYLQKLINERNAQQLPAKLTKLFWAIGGWIIGIVTAGISAWIEKAFK